MNKKELTVAIAAILTTLAEVEGSPESMLYISLGMGISKYEVVRNVLVSAKWVHVANHYVTITPAGRAMADAVNSALSK